MVCDRLYGVLLCMTLTTVPSDLTSVAPITCEQVGPKMRVPMPAEPHAKVHKVRAGHMTHGSWLSERQGPDKPRTYATSKGEAHPCDRGVSEGRNQVIDCCLAVNVTQKAATCVA